jgi:hypothetical protein
MRSTLTILSMLARLIGVVQIVTGLSLWLGWLTNARTLHIALGSLLALVIWIIALLALFALSTRGVALFTLLWGALMLWLGMAQTGLLVGTGHWAVRLAHLLVGLAALGLAESLTKAVKAHWSARAA